MRVPFVLLILVVAMISTHSIAQEKLVILAAHYGDLPDGKKFDVTKKVADLVKENSLRLEASNDLFGDPVEQVGKKLSVRFKLGDQESETQVTEGETLLVPIPKLVGELIIQKAIYGDLPDGPTYDVTESSKATSAIINSRLRSRTTSWATLLLERSNACESNIPSVKSSLPKVSTKEAA